MCNLRQTLLHNCDEVFEIGNEFHRGRQSREHPQLSHKFLLLYLFLPLCFAHSQLLLADILPDNILFGYFFALRLVQVFLRIRCLVNLNIDNW